MAGRERLLGESSAVALFRGASLQSTRAARQCRARAHSDGRGIAPRGPQSAGKRLFHVSTTHPRRTSCFSLRSSGRNDRPQWTRGAPSWAKALPPTRSLRGAAADSRSLPAGAPRPVRHAPFLRGKTSSLFPRPGRRSLRRPRVSGTHAHSCRVARDNDGSGTGPPGIKSDGHRRRIPVASGQHHHRRSPSGA